MKKLIMALIACAAGVLNAGGKLATIPSSGWDGNPVYWVDRNSHLDVCALSGFAIAKDFACARRMTFVADLTPQGVSTNNPGYATFGVAGFENAQRFWHMALVRRPVAQGSGHVFEFCERKGKDWPAQHKEGLRTIPGSVRNGTWEFGKTYRLEIRFGDGRVEGIAKDSDGKILYRLAYELKPGTVDAGRPALHVTGGFAGRVDSAQAASDDCLPPAGQPAEPVVVPYANGAKPVSDRIHRATGFFRIEAGDDGRHTAIDPCGREVVLLGVNSVTYDGCGTRGPVRRYREWNNAHYPSREAWAEETLGRLKEWGFNRLSGGNTNLYRRGLMHSRNLRLGGRLCLPHMPQEYWICPNPGKPCAAFPNVFHPLFRAWCDYEARELCSESRNDPWLFGYYSDNELAWWGRGARDAGLYNETLKLPAWHTARQALEKFVRERGCNDPEKASNELRLDFLRLAADIYFRETTAAVRAVDPNHLQLGARFAGMSGAHEAVWEIAGKYCDAVTFNIYPWADLDRNVVRLNSSLHSQSIADAFAERAAVVKKPFLITEWSFPSLDSGLPCTKGAGQRLHTQSQRTRATELFARTMLNLPSVIGYDYFMWVDEPPEGVSDVHPEDTNYGLVSEEGKPYPLAQMFARLHADIPAVRASGVPAECAAPAPNPSASPLAAAVAKEMAAAAKDKSAIIVPAPKVGKCGVIEGITTADGAPLGEFSMMLACRTNGRTDWMRATHTTSVTPRGDNAWRVECTGRGRNKEKFSFVVDVTTFPGTSCFLADVAELRNLGNAPLDVAGIYFRVTSPFAAESDVKQVPNMWKRPCVSRWQAQDGRWIGARSTAATAARCHFRYDHVRKTQHPDSVFEPLEPLLLAPQGVYSPGGMMWCIIEGGVKE